jgi:GIY-YIG catalytic domain
MIQRMDLLGKYKKQHPEIDWRVSSQFLDLPEKISGVYSVSHTPTGMIYYGSSTNLQPRIKQHFFTLSRGEHSNQIFQDLWDESAVCSWKILYSEQPVHLIRRFEKVFISITERKFLINKNIPRK